MKRTTDPRDSRILINTTPQIKEHLEAIARGCGWSLSLLCHEVLQEWLEQQEAGDG
jgi:hypothetical protein